jgi:Fe2+ or Zn2+ uptake regulation protein
MRKYKSINSPFLVETLIVCNKCGKTYDLEEQDLEEWQADFMHRVSWSFGYASKHDGEEWVLDLCEDCIKEFVNSFLVAPEVIGPF